MNLIEQIAGWLGSHAWYIASSVVSIFIGVLLSLFLRYWFATHLDSWVFYRVRRLKLRLEKNIQLQAQKAVTLSLKGIGHSDLPGVIANMPQGLQGALRPNFKNVAMSGETGITGVDSSDSNIRIRLDLDDTHSYSPAAPEYGVLLTADTTTEYGQLVESILGLTTELDKLRDAVSKQSIETSSVPGHATLRIHLRKPPVILTAFSRLDITDLHSEFEGFTMDLEKNGVIFRGEFTRDMAAKVREVVTWYY